MELITSGEGSKVDMLSFYWSMTWISVIALQDAMAPRYSKTDQYLRTMGKVEPEPPNGGEKVTDNEESFLLIFILRSVYKIFNLSAHDL